MKVYLKDNVQLAPYIWDWYAWGHLIAPHSAAANISERHLKIMESFIDSPDLHLEAIQLHGMIGGPFINLDPQKVDKIVNLVSHTKQQCEKLITLNSDIKYLDSVLKISADGVGMEDIYSKIPHSLKGMIELVYDINNSPQIRFIEPLIYKNYYDDQHQSICMTQTLNDKRSFCLSTPFIERNDTVKLQMPFSSKTLDSLAQMKSYPSSWENILEQCKLPDLKINLFKSFFTENKPRFDNQYKESGIRIRYFGHACVLLQTSQVNILIDPVLGYNYDEKQSDRLTLRDLPDEIDYVLITHNHQDHFLFETLLQLRHKIKNIVVPSNINGSIVDPSMKLILKSIGFINIIVLNEFDEISLATDGVIMALPFLGEHGDLNIQSKLSYYVSLKGNTFLFLADSNNLDCALYEQILRITGKVDTIFIGMECQGAPSSWLYGPLFSSMLSHAHDNSRRLSGSNAQKAWEIVKLFSCREVYVYAMGMEPWLSYIMAIDYNESSLPIIESNKFIAICKAHNVNAMRLYGKQQWDKPAINKT